MHGMDVFTWRDGAEYAGEMKRNTIRGKGGLKWPHANGDSFNSYDGDIVDGVRHGVGTFVKRNCRGEVEVTYEGEWRDGLRHGQGRLTVGLAEVEWYEGSWHKGIKCGHGAMQWRSGNILAGAWKNDLRHGRGRTQWLDSRRWRPRSWRRLTRPCT